MAPRVSANAAYMVLHELCRPPRSATVSNTQCRQILRHLERRFRHPLLSGLRNLVLTVMRGERLSVSAAAAAMRKVSRYPGQYNMLAICYFSSDDRNGRLDRLYEETVARWESPHNLFNRDARNSRRTTRSSAPFASFIVGAPTPSVTVLACSQLVANESMLPRYHYDIDIKISYNNKLIIIEGNKMSKSLSAKIVIASALAFGGMAHAEVLTFDNTAGAAMPGATSVFEQVYTYFDHPSVYQNYAFSARDGQWYAGHWNSVVFCGGSNVDCAYNGTDHLIARPSLSVRRADGALFAVNGFDLDNTRDNGVVEAAASFMVTGFKTDGTHISTIVTLDDLPNIETYGTAAAFNHFDLVGFTNLSSFEINRITPNAWGSMALDNLNVTAVTAVPEPSSWLMMGLGLLGLGAQLKRRKG